MLYTIFIMDQSTGHTKQWNCGLRSNSLCWNSILCVKIGMHNTERVKELRFAIHIETILSTSTFCPSTQRAFSQYAFKWIELSAVECFLRNKTNKSNAIWFKVLWRYHRAENCNAQKNSKLNQFIGWRRQKRFGAWYKNANSISYTFYKCSSRRLWWICIYVFVIWYAFKHFVDLCII